MTEYSATFQRRLDETKTVTDPHQQFHTIRFSDGAMDFGLQWLLGTTRNGGAEIGEVLTTAAGITDGDPDSWAEAWPALAARVAARGRASAARGHQVSARELLLRAACYHRATLTALSPADPEFLGEYQRSAECLAEASALGEPRIEPITVPFGRTDLPGCLIAGDRASGPRPTLLAIGGAETFFLDLYFHIGPQALARGYTFATVDLPGQGVLPGSGAHFRPDTELPIGAVVDALLDRPEVDPDRLAVYGISAGGYFAPRAAAHDPRIKACVANCGLPSLGDLLSAMVGATPPSAEVEVPLSAFNRRMLEIMAWRFGAGETGLAGIAERSRPFVLDPGRIPCPVLSIVSEGEYLNPLTHRLVDSFVAGLRHPASTMTMLGFADGAGTHCAGENTGLLACVLFDWLDEVFGTPSAPVSP